MNQICMSFIKEIFRTSYNKDIPWIETSCFKYLLRSQEHNKIRHTLTLFEAQVFSMEKQRKTSSLVLNQANLGFLKKT